MIETGAFGRDMLRNALVKDSIRGIVRQLSGIDCRLGPYSPSGGSANSYSAEDTPHQEAIEAAVSEMLSKESTKAVLSTAERIFPHLC